MTSIPEIKARLAGAGTPFTFVRGATDLAMAKDRPDAILPIAFVLAPRDASAENTRATGSVLQRSERDIKVVYVVGDVSDAEGNALTDALEEIKSFVRGRLIGFVPTDMVEPITHIGGEVVQAVEGCVWFEDDFSAPIYLKEQV